MTRKCSAVEKENAQLRRDLDAGLKAAHDLAFAHHQRQAARIAELETALKPIVAWCEKLEAEFSDHAGDIVAASFNGVFVTFDDLRRARAALRPAEKGDAT